MPKSSFLNYWSKSRQMQHSPSTLCNPWRKNLNGSNFWSCKCCWELLEPCVWLQTCSSLQESLWERSPWQGKCFLVLACHSPTQPLQEDGISVLSDSISPSAVLFSVPLVHTNIGPAFSRTESDQELGLTPWLARATPAFAHSRLWILLFTALPFICF